MPTEEQYFAYLDKYEMHHSTKQEYFKALMTVTQERFESVQNFEEAFPRLTSRYPQTPGNTQRFHPNHTSGHKFDVKQVQQFLSRRHDADGISDPLAVRTRAVVICILFGGTTVRLSVLRRMTYGDVVKKPDCFVIRILEGEREHFTLSRESKDGVDYYKIFDTYYDWITRTMQPSSTTPLFYGLRLKYYERLKDEFNKTLITEDKPWINAAMGVKDFNGVVQYVCEQLGLDPDRYTALSFKIFNNSESLAQAESPLPEWAELQAGDFRRWFESEEKGEKVFSDVDIAKFFKAINMADAQSVTAGALAATVIRGKLSSNTIKYLRYGGESLIV